MTRAQRKARIQNLENKCKTLQKQNEKKLQEQQEAFREREEEYIKHIEILQKRLMDGKYYRIEKVCVDIDQREHLMMYQNVNIPKNVIDEYINQQTMDAMLRELSKRTDLLQRQDFGDRTTFYMEVLVVDDRPLPTITIPREFSTNPYSEVTE